MIFLIDTSRVRRLVVLIAYGISSAFSISHNVYIMRAKKKWVDDLEVRKIQTSFPFHMDPWKSCAGPEY